MRALGFDVKKPDIVKIVHDIDPNNTGTVNYQQFLEISKRPLHYIKLRSFDSLISFICDLQQ